MLTSKVFASAMAMLCAVVEARNTIPVLSNVRLEATGDRLKLTTTDMDSWVELELAAPGVGEWVTTAPVHPMLSYLKTFARTDSEVAFTPPADDPRLTITIGHSAMKFPVLDAETFPIYGQPGEGYARVMANAADLGPMLKAAAPYMSKDSARYVLNSACLGAGPDGGVTLTATNGTRLFQQNVRGAALEGALESAIIPRRVVSWLAKFMPKAGDVWVEVAEQWACIDIPGARIITKLIDAAYPVFVAPDRVTIATVDFKALRDSIDLVSTVCVSTRDKPIFIRLGAGELTITATDYEGGEAETVLDVDADANAVLAMKFSAQLLLSSLKAFKRGDTLELEYADDYQPMVIRSAERPDCEIVVSPFRKEPVAVPLDRPVVEFTVPESTYRAPGEYSYMVETRVDSLNRPETRRFTFSTEVAAYRAYRRHLAAARVGCEVKAEPITFSTWTEDHTRIVVEIPAAGFVPLPVWYLAQQRERITAMANARLVFEQTEEGDVPWTRKVLELANVSELLSSPALTVARGRTQAIRQAGERRLTQAAKPIRAVVQPEVAAPIEVVAAPAGFTELTVDYLLNMEARAERLANAINVFASVNDNDVPWTRKIFGLKLCDAVESTPLQTVMKGRSGPIRALGATALKRAA